MKGSGARGILAVMGSGETSPTMVTWHRRLMEHAGGRAVLLDTSYGFQENADDISGRAEEYFVRNVGLSIEVVRLGPDASSADRERAYERLRGASYVFAGPGSPTFALRSWAGTPVPEILRDRLEAGATLCFASAAALTLGRWTVPVYEIYKAGHDPAWLEGLDLLGTLGLGDAALIPHFDNAEGGHHDTRFCYLGDRRLRQMERLLDDEVTVIGVDEHTIAVFDFGAGSLSAGGRGRVSLRRHGEIVGVLEADDDPVDLASFMALPTGANAGVSARTSESAGEAADTPAPASPLLERAGECDARCSAALEDGDFEEAGAAIIALEDELAGWAADTLQSDEVDRARAILRSMIIRTAEAAAQTATTAAGVNRQVELLVEGLAVQRGEARAGSDYAAADRIRELLASAGVEIRDTPEGQQWSRGEGSTTP